MWEWLLSVFPDHRFDIEDAAAEGETVAVRGTCSGTHEGEVLGIPPTGKRFAAQQSHWLRVADGKVADHWAVRDDLGMMRTAWRHARAGTGKGTRPHVASIH